MHPVRRRKKRPNYGVRTVEVSRGDNGFGFTISGQQPCILSCIVPGSPAESAGLRAGDYLVAVGGKSVSKVLHDDVVRLIASSSGVLKLQIAESYYSDSSDDDVLVTARQKPKYPHKLRSNVQNARTNGTQQGRAAKVVRDLRSGAMFVEPAALDLASPVASTAKASKGPESPQWKVPHLPPPLPRLYVEWPPRSASRLPEAEVEEHEILEAVVGYLGTIEMPRKIPPGSRLQIVRGCIKRLRAEKRSHTAVLMAVLTRSLRLTNPAGQVLAVYPADRVAFCGVSSDEDRRHFGVVTTSASEDPSNSCHVFVIDSRLHADHQQKAQLFKIDCEVDAVTGHCRQFPVNSDGVVAAVRSYYESGNDVVDEPVMADSPQPSNDSTTTTSNSDSGIGFRDDCGNQLDRILVVDVQNQRLHIQQIGDCEERLAVRAMPDAHSASNRSRSPLSSSNSDCAGVAREENMSVSSGAKSPHQVHSTDDMSVSSLYNKLSPKVFNVAPPPTSQSLEDLKVGEEAAESSPSSLARTQQHWGSLQELRSFVSDCFESTATTERLEDTRQDGVSCWATSFEKLLEDPDGLHAFAEFLKKEISHENIYFWVACERYRSVEDDEERQRLAREIFDKHLCLGAPEPVNVDSHARQVTQEQLGAAHPHLFLQAQKQIFNLMKFDSYPRFIKSDLYQECSLRETTGEKLPFHGKIDAALELHHSNHSKSSSNSSPQQLHTKLKKSRSDAEERSRRKSFKPWSRKSRCKSRDRVAGAATATGDDVDAESSVSLSSRRSSRSSLASWDLALNSGSLCRVVLPDGATTVVQIRPPQTVRQLVQRLLEKRALGYAHFQVFLAHSDKPLILDEDATTLGGQEVRVENLIVFQLDLPNRKTVKVKSKVNESLAQVLRPILQKYNYRLEMVTLCLMSENEVVEPSVSVVTVDNQRLQVLTRSTPTECWHASECGPPPSHGKVKSAATLDEITNRVFEELLQGKSEGTTRRTASDQGSLRSEDWGSENSSGLVSRFLRRDSAFLERGRDFRHRSKKAAKHHPNSNASSSAAARDEGSSGGGVGGGTPAAPTTTTSTTTNATGTGSASDKKPVLTKLPPIIAKLKPGNKVEGKSESEELPDFLKDKENAPQSGKKFRKLRRDGGAESIGNSKFYPDSTEETRSGLSYHNENAPTTPGLMSRLSQLEQSFSADGIIPDPDQAQDYFMGRKATATPVAQLTATPVAQPIRGTRAARGDDPPPPLPPKPKLPPPPPTSSWPLDRNDTKLRNCRVRRTVYLDQPSSSFV
ncbi:regulator of G-protein signaling loco [Nilaparvata lugens]|uniref:regulator of G-protein signaling loco n=1 Tax=Nilaparvata lugens TaxID=108931 RepID=UPI00193E0EDF|nr:regulator of G-protein signaling loco [Nilaparvata lugens]